MRAYQFPQTEVERATVVSRFGGVDFRTHPTKVSLSRSPDMQNLICDQNDFLVKRTGWKTQQAYTAPIYGLFPLPDGTGFAVHAGAKLYCRPASGSQTELCSDMKQAFSQSFVMNGVLYLLDGQTFRAVRRNAANTGWEAVKVQDIAYVPTTTISAAPTGGGTSYEAVNLLTPKRINTFIGNGSATQPSPFQKPSRARRIRSTNAALPACTAAKTIRVCLSQATRMNRTATGKAGCTTPPTSRTRDTPAWARTHPPSSATSSSTKASSSSNRAARRRRPATCAPT